MTIFYKSKGYDIVRGFNTLKVSPKFISIFYFTISLIEYLFIEFKNIKNSLKARGFNGINADANYWNFENKRRNKKQKLSISREIFEDDLKLKLFKKSEWKKSFVKFTEIDEEEHDDLPF